MRPRADALFFKPNLLIHVVCSVLSFDVSFAFQNRLLWCAENKMQTCFQEKFDYLCVAICIFRSTETKFCERNYFDQNIDNAF